MIGVFGNTPKEILERAQKLYNAFSGGAPATAAAPVAQPRAAPQATVPQAAPAQAPTLPVEDSYGISKTNPAAVLQIQGVPQEAETKPGKNGNYTMFSIGGVKMSAFDQALGNAVTYMAQNGQQCTIKYKQQGKYFNALGVYDAGGQAPAPQQNMAADMPADSEIPF